LGDIEGHREHSVRRRLDQVVNVGDVTRGDDGIVAGSDDGRGERATESG
jgi:hypothetical protein